MTKAYLPLRSGQLVHHASRKGTPGRRARGEDGKLPPMPSRRTTLTLILACASPAPAWGAEAWRRVRTEDQSGELAVPPGWRAQVQDDAVALLSPPPATVVISLGHYEPRDEARYTSWSTWTGRMLARRKGHSPIKHRPLAVGGYQAVRVETASPASDHLVVETWIAVPRPGGAGEVMALTLDTNGALPETRPFLRLYERILHSLTFPAKRR
jgi:hypothetical protein